MSNAATNILRQFWNNTTPVDPAFIAAKMGVDVHADANFGEGSGEYFPFGKNGHGTPTIVYNARESAVRKRFTIAHELGHHVLGHGQSPRDTDYPAAVADPRERDANAFAAELLMPADAIKAFIHVRNIQTIEQLAWYFQVSTAAMTYRLRGLGYNA